MKFKPFSKKQMAALSWWHPDSNYSSYDAIICDGAVRSGKTVCTALSFIVWAMTAFDKGLFALCGKTIVSLRRNVILPVSSMLEMLGFETTEQVSKNTVTVKAFGRENRFCLFSGKDEGSAALIQGVTLSGVLFDEVALMPRSFVEQALARCSVQGSKFFFNCNPEFPAHWFYKEWIQKARSKNALYLHFTMRDNPSLSEKMIRRYESLYSGAFFRRFVLGEWVSVSGAVYPFMSDSAMYPPVPDVEFDDYCVSCDYGTVNPTSMGLWGKHLDVWYRIREYYYDSKKEDHARTDEEHYEALLSLCDGRDIGAVIVDPSARSFIEVINRHSDFCAIPAENSVVDGIRKTSSALKEKSVVICDTCSDSKREFSLYRWDGNKDSDTVVKKDDHAMDDIRYFVSYITGGESGFAAMTAYR